MGRSRRPKPQVQVGLVLALGAVAGETLLVRESPIVGGLVVALAIAGAFVPLRQRSRDRRSRTGPGGRPQPAARRPRPVARPTPAGRSGPDPRSAPAPRAAPDGRTANPARVGAVAGDEVPADPVDMTGPQFERFVAGLLQRDGCEDVRVSGGAGDRGADLAAISPEGHRVVVQCKRYGPRKPVTDPDMQRFLGTARQVHNAAIPLFVTTSRYTRAAAELAREHGIATVDGRRLDDWIRRAWRLPREPTEFVGEIRG